MNEERLGGRNSSGHLARTPQVGKIQQLAPGGQVHFARCNLEMAAELRRHTRERLEGAVRGISWAYGK